MISWSITPDPRTDPIADMIIYENGSGQSESQLFEFSSRWHLNSSRLFKIRLERTLDVTVASSSFDDLRNAGSNIPFFNWSSSSVVNLSNPRSSTSFGLAFRQNNRTGVYTAEFKITIEAYESNLDTVPVEKTEIIFQMRAELRPRKFIEAVPANLDFGDVQTRPNRPIRTTILRSVGPDAINVNNIAIVPANYYEATTSSGSLPNLIAGDGIGAFNVDVEFKSDETSSLSNRQNVNAVLEIVSDAENTGKDLADNQKPLEIYITSRFINEALIRVVPETRNVTGPNGEQVKRLEFRSGSQHNLTTIENHFTIHNDGNIPLSIINMELTSSGTWKKFSPFFIDPSNDL